MAITQDCGEVKKAFRLQAKRYGNVNAGFNAEICDLIAKHVSKNNKLQKLLLKYQNQRHIKQVAQRFVAATHALFYGGKAQSLSPYLVDRSDDYSELWAKLVALIEEFEMFFRHFLYLKVIDEDVGRSAILVGATAKLHQLYGMPFNLYQMQARAGLNLCFDKFAFEISGFPWGDLNSKIKIEPEWEGIVPRLDFAPNIINRYGCDPHTLNLDDAIDELQLRSYVSANNSLRLSDLDENMVLIQSSNAKIEASTNLEWAKNIFGEMRKGQVHLVFHMCGWSLVNEDLQAACEVVHDNAMLFASPERPIAHLSYEYNEDDGFGEVLLRLWDGANHNGKAELVGKSDQFGEFVMWFDDKRNQKTG